MYYVIKYWDSAEVWANVDYKLKLDESYGTNKDAFYSIYELGDEWKTKV